MKIEEIKELIHLLEESKLNMMEISEGENRIRLEKAAEVKVIEYSNQARVIKPGSSLWGGALCEEANGQAPTGPAAAGVAGFPHGALSHTAGDLLAGSQAAYSQAPGGYAAVSQSAVNQAASAGHPVHPLHGGASEAVSASGEESRAPLGKAVTSPMVGVFYKAPSPGEAAFVEVGSHVKKGDVLCIVEAMKLMNEIVSETAGEIVEICCEDGQVVEYGQPLFYIR